MNTLEIKYKGIIKNWFSFINIAKLQFVNYEKLEGRNWKKYDFSIDCSEDQSLFKDMLQIRCIEELTEASIAFKENSYDHFKEEITDALNFYLSSMVMCNYSKMNKEPLLPKKSQSYNIFKMLTDGEIHYMFYSIIEKIGYLCNLLKNRPWAQSNYLVSMTDFNERLDDLWLSFWRMIYNLGISRDEVFELFERKYEVNKWRIKTGY